MVKKPKIGVVYFNRLGKGFKLHFRRDKDANGEHIHCYVYWRKKPKAEEHYCLTEDEAYTFMKRLMANPPPRNLKITHVVRMEEWYNPAFIEPTHPKRNWTVEFISEQPYSEGLLEETRAWVRESLRLEEEPCLELTQYSDGVVHVSLPQEKKIVAFVDVPQSFKKSLATIKEAVADMGEA